MTCIESSALDRLLRSFEVRMKLDDLLHVLPASRIIGSGGTEFSGLSYDSRSTAPGDLFIAIRGTREDGTVYVNQALEKGAVAVMSDRAIDSLPPVPLVLVKDARGAKARAAAAFFRDPSQRLDCIGVTGTNGKTTVSYMLKRILEQDGRSTGLIGTICHHIGMRTVPSLNTTPDPVDLQRFLAEMVDENQDVAVMEVSSHALSQARVGALAFKAGVFTNLSRDHLDYHITMDEYERAKSLLFASLARDAFAVINMDDPAAETMRRACACPVIRYGFKRGLDVTAELRRVDIDGFSMILKTPSGDIDITSRLPGRFNVMNAMAAAATATAMGVPLTAVKSGFESLRSIKGRMESVDCGQDFRLIVDYAHTHDALSSLLSHLKPLTKGRLIAVFGCGGDRDKSKRPMMAEAATKMADHTVITSDNPRSEDPSSIIDDIRCGVVSGASMSVEQDRRTAIEEAVRMAGGGDIVVIAGKGHEDYQVLKDGTIDFDDRKVAEEVLWNLSR